MFAKMNTSKIYSGGKHDEGDIPTNFVAMDERFSLFRGEA